MDNIPAETITSARRAWYPWLVWLLSSSFIFYKYVLQVSPSVMVNELMQAFDLSGQALGNLAAFYFYAYLAMQLPVGVLLDRFNPRYLISVAVLICVMGALIFATAKVLAVAEIGRLCIGLGGAFSAVGAMKLISIWFKPQRFALMSGLMMSLAMLGAVGGQAPLALLVEHVGWRQSMMVCMWLGLLLALLIYAIIRERVTTSDVVDTVTQMRILPAISRIIRQPQSWLISLYSGLAFAPISAFAGLWGVPFMVEKYGLQRSHAAAMVSLVFIGFALGSPLAGWLSDRIKRRKPIMIIGTSMSLVCLSLVIYANVLPNGLLSVLLFTFGFFTGFFFVSFAAMREMHDISQSGSAIGFINMFNALCGALSEPLIGKLLDMGWDHTMLHGARVFSVMAYEHALLALPLALVVALMLQVLIKETACEQS